MSENKRRKKFIGTRLQKKLLLLIIFSAVIPAGIIALGLYYLIFYLLAWQIGIPEAIAYNVIPVVNKVNSIVFIVLPLSLLIIWVIALELSNRIAGPVYRLEKELDLRISGEKRGPITVRKKDELRLLVDKINKLIK